MSFQFGDAMDSPRNSQRNPTEALSAHAFRRRRTRFFPFISVLTLVGILLAVVFVKMEIRRTGYVVLKLSRQKRASIAEYRREQIRFASLTRPDRIEHYAQTHLELKHADRAQVIQMMSPNVVLRD